MTTFRRPLSDVPRPTLEADVVIVGAGPAGLACALRLSQLIDEHNARTPGSAVSKERVLVLEKGREVGAHCMSGAVLDPRGMQELLPGFEREAPLGPAVVKEAIYLLGRRRKLKSPVIPPAMRDHGNHLVSLNHFVKWLGEKTARAGIAILTGSAGAELIFEQGRVAGVRTDDKGVGKDGGQKRNFEPGCDVKAGVVVLAEGTRGSLAKQLAAECGIERDSNPQDCGLGVKELWEVPPGRIQPGEVIYSLGYPLTLKQYGGAWIYGIQEGVVSLGLAMALDSRDPGADPHQLLQQLKGHPLVHGLLDGGRIIRCGAKSLPYGGWWSVPRTAGDGWLLLGDSAGFVNSQRLKGIHLAIKSGMLAAETAFEALLKGDFSGSALHAYTERVQESWIRTELWPVRNYHQGFQNGILTGLFHAALQQVSGGRGVRDRYPSHAGRPPARLPYKTPDFTFEPARQEAPDAIAQVVRRNGRLTIDKLTAVYHSGTKHEEDQPAHMVIQDTDICNGRCVVEFGNPCRNFCPGNVYEMVEAPGMPNGIRIRLNPSNCLHCKTCDILDPYQIITWVPPEGGGGPSYGGM